ncbi:MAG: acriflavin resistance protein [Proteobacteria bacterium]|nr:MAG: acriflavin resistance protein [Pseudomonadota bacterium]
MSTPSFPSAGSPSDHRKPATNQDKPAINYHKNDIIGRFAQHKVAANLLMLILLISGIYSLGKLNRQFFPNFAVDFIVVKVVWPGASAEDVEKSVVRPLEQELRNLSNVKEMNSTSSRGVASVVMEYEEGTDMGLALNQTKEFVGLIRNLPTDAEAPEVTKVVRYEEIATLILTSEGSLEELRPLAYQFERELLDRGIAKVEMTGLPQQEIAIEVSSETIQTLNLSHIQIGDRIRQHSQDIPAGAVGRSEAEREIRSLEKRRTAEGFESLPITTTEDGQKLTVGDIGEVTLRAKENGVEVYYRGHPAVLLKLKRSETTDSLKSAEVMHTWLDEKQHTLPDSIQLIPTNELYVFVEQRINLLLKNGISGLILVVAILFIFLNGRVAFWVACGIPISFMGALTVLYFSGGSINMLSLFALIMALGIIVDDAIVVAEDALTHYQTGEGSLQAAEGGARRMFVPVMSSSLTTLAAFLPLMLIGGIIGTILSDIPFVVVCVILASLIECFLILPGHLRHSFHKNHHKAPGRVRARLDASFNYFRDHLFYSLISTAMKYRGVTLTTALALLICAFSLVKYGQVKFNFFPQPESPTIFASIKFAAGTPPETIRQFAFDMERTLWETAEELKTDKDLVKASYIRLNAASFSGGQRFQRGDQYAMVTVELSMPDERTVRNPEFIKQWRANLDLPAGVEILSMRSPSGGPPGKDIDIFLTGGNADTLKAAAEELTREMKVFKGISDIVDDLPYGKQQFIFSLTTEGESLGLSVANVGSQIRAALDGRLLQVFYNQDEEIEVRIMLPGEERHFQRTLQTLPVVTPSGQTLPLANVINLESRRGLEILRHSDARLGVHVTAEVNTKITNINDVLTSIQTDIIPGIIDKYGLSVSYKGKAEEQAETNADMAQGAILAVIGIYIILAWVFASYSWPLAVMLAIPFGIGGAIFGHWLLGINLTLLSQFGIFGLSGIVINDAIILISFYKQLREKGMAVRKALVRASCQRLRAVLLTSLTTIAGLLPLLFESSLQAQFLIPMAVSISFGLAFATLLVLIVIPVMLSYIESFSTLVSKARERLL